MTGFEPRIERLEPMLVASTHAFGVSPEMKAWGIMEAWAGPIGLLDDLEKHPVFGFNNPNPTSESAEYGYEFWMAVDSETEAGPEIAFKRFGGGLYAVSPCELSKELGSEFFQKEGYLEPWKKLLDWVNESPYKHGSHQGLERPCDPMVPESELVLDLYFPIEE
jgi:DNA gyrase inhibitor GyrI